MGLVQRPSDYGGYSRQVGVVQDTDGNEVEVTGVRARVMLSSTALRELKDAGTGVSFQSAREGPDSLSLSVSLSAALSDARVIAGGPGRDLGLGGPRRGIWHRWHGPALPDDPADAKRIALREHRVDIHDIEDGINQMLGRDPTLHRPPRLSWSRLIDALTATGLHVSEQTMIDTPLTVELMPDVESELGRDLS